MPLVIPKPVKMYLGSTRPNCSYSTVQWFHRFQMMNAVSLDFVMSAIKMWMDSLEVGKFGKLELFLQKHTNSTLDNFDLFAPIDWDDFDGKLFFSLPSYNRISTDINLTRTRFRYAGLLFLVEPNVSNTVYEERSLSKFVSFVLH